jgi:hypothetical protein
VPGWNGYVKKSKTPAELDLKRRREAGMQHYSTLEELQEIASASKRKITRLPPVTDDEPPPPAEAFVGPCQSHIEFFKNRRAVRAAGQVEVVQDDAPYVDPITAKREASREYHRDLAAAKALPGWKPRSRGKKAKK